MKPLSDSTGSSRRTAAIGVVAVALTVGASGVAYALATADRQPTEVTAGDTAPAAPVDDPTPVTQDPTPAEVVPGPDEYTQERSDAFWAAGYAMEDAFALADLWHLDVLEAKGRAGQLLIDGQAVPVAPGSSLDLTDPDTVAQLAMVAFWDAGYTYDDGVELAALWNVDVGQAKATAGQMLRDGQSLPIAPSGTPAS